MSKTTLINKIINSNYAQTKTTTTTTTSGVSALFTISGASVEQGTYLSVLDASTGFISKYEYYLNGSLVSTNKNPIIFITQLGLNTLKLKVSGGGFFDEYELDFNVVVGAFSCEISASPLVGESPLEVQFASVVVGGVSPFTFSWKSRVDNTTFVEFSTQANPLETFTTLGIYDIQLDVEDSDGLVTTIIKQNFIEVSDMLANFIATPLIGTLPLSVSFVNQSVGNTEEYLWEISTDQNNWVVIGTTKDLNYVFDFAGYYSVRLTINNGLQTSVETKVSYIEAGDVMASGVQQDNFVVSSADQDSQFEVVLTHTIETLFIDGCTILDSSNQEIGADFEVVDKDNVKIKYLSAIVGNHKIMVQGVQGYEV